MSDQAISQHKRLAMGLPLETKATGPDLHDPPGDNPGRQSPETMKQRTASRAMGFKQFKKGAR